VSDCCGWACAFFILDLIFIASFVGLVTYGLTHLEIFSSQGTKWFYRIWGKLGATLMLLACLGVLWFSLAGNLLRFSSTY
jgi:hypothetical protein